jgi:hypothetical protein
VDTTTSPTRACCSRNTDKTKDTDPDYRGSGKVGGCDYWISGWVNTSQNGTKFMSLKMRPKASAKDRITHADDNLGIG